MKIYAQFVMNFEHFSNALVQQAVSKKKSGLTQFLEVGGPTKLLFTAHNNIPYIYIY